MRRKDFGRDLGLSMRMALALAITGAISALCIVSARPRRRLKLSMDHPSLDKRLRHLEEIAREMGRPV